MEVSYIPIGSPLWHYCAISNHSAAVCHRISPTLQSTQELAKFGEEEVDRRKPNFNAILERHGAVACKRIVPISSAVWAQCTNVTDRQTDHWTVTSIAIDEIACQRCRLNVWIYNCLNPKLTAPEDARSIIDSCLSRKFKKVFKTFVFKKLFKTHETSHSTYYRPTWTTAS